MSPVNHPLTLERIWEEDMEDDTPASINDGSDDGYVLAASAEASSCNKAPPTTFLSLKEDSIT